MIRDGFEVTGEACATQGITGKKRQREHGKRGKSSSIGIDFRTFNQGKVDVVYGLGRIGRLSKIPTAVCALLPYPNQNKSTCKPGIYAPTTPKPTSS